MSCTENLFGLFESVLNLASCKKGRSRGILCLSDKSDVIDMRTYNIATAIRMHQTEFVIVDTSCIVCFDRPVS